MANNAAEVSNTSANLTDDSPVFGRTMSFGGYEYDLDNFAAMRGRPRSRSLYSSCRPLVYITRRVPQLGLDILMSTCNISQWDSEEAVPRGELLQCVQGVHGILCLPSDFIDKEILEAAGTNLRAVATLSQGTSHIDVEECARRNIRVLNCPPPDISAQADLTVALILLTLRNVTKGPGQYEHMIHAATCDMHALTEGKPVDVTSAWWASLIQRKTFGVYGMTSLGVAVASRLRQLGASRVVIADFGCDAAWLKDNEETMSNANMEGIQYVSREMFFEHADVICVCDSRATTQNDAVFDQVAFRNMKSGVILVNSDSGNALNYMALYEALRDGEIYAAGLNTCNQTSVPFKYPLQGLKNCVFLPQTQESAYDLRHKTTVGVATSLLKALKESLQIV